jgi:hypothetical protein
MRMPRGPEPEEGVVDPQAEATRRLAETRDAGTEEAVGRLEAAEAKAAEQTSSGWWVLCRLGCSGILGALTSWVP